MGLESYVGLKQYLKHLFEIETKEDEGLIEECENFPGDFTDIIKGDERVGKTIRL